MKGRVENLPLNQSMFIGSVSYEENWLGEVNFHLMWLSVIKILWIINEHRVLQRFFEPLRIKKTGSWTVSYIEQAKKLNFELKLTYKWQHLEI
jgi:hypothetical protein